MKIVVLTGSPHKRGTTNLLAEQFIKGAKDAQNEVTRFDSAFAKVHPCIGCERRGTGKNTCVFQDDMIELYKRIIDADAVVLATPLYYHGYSAQLKTVIDRFHGIDDLIRGQSKKAALLAAGANPNKWITDGLLVTYHTELRYLGWIDRGTVLASGCYSAEDIAETNYPQMAYELGRSFC